MSLNLYDEALKLKLEKIFPNVKIAPPDVAFKDGNIDGKVELPMITAWRLSNPPNWENFNYYDSFNGRVSKYDNTKDSAYLTQGIPITITYQIDIYAQLREYADGIYRELMYYLLTNPNLRIKIPDTDSEFDGSMTLTDVDSSTDYTSFDNTNILHRYTLTYELPYAKLFFSKESNKLVYNIPLTLTDIYDNNTFSYDDSTGRLVTTVKSRDGKSSGVIEVNENII